MNMFRPHASTSVKHMDMGSSTRPDKVDEKRMEMPMRGIPGLVSSVGTDSFKMALPGNKDKATTTVTVNITSATTFTRASTTVALSDLAEGTRVVVLGKFSTSTKTIAAERVMVGGEGKGMKEGNRKGLIERLKHLFFQKREEAKEISTEATSAAVVEGNGVGNLLFRAVLGWI